MTRHNDRSLRGRDGSWVKNGDRWVVRSVDRNGDLHVARPGHHARRLGAGLRLPADYVGHHGQPDRSEALCVVDVVPQIGRFSEREARKQGLTDWMDLAQKWFAANLRRSPGKAAREYLEKRGLPEDQWERFRLGYAPNDPRGAKGAPGS